MVMACRLLLEQLEPSLKGCVGGSGMRGTVRQRGEPRDLERDGKIESV